VPSLRLGEIVRLLDRRFPPGNAEPWDAVGLVVGDPAAEVDRALFAVDPVAATVREALDWGADLLVCHHPLFLKGVHGVAATSAKGRVAHDLVRGGCALYVAHTNADAAPGGVADSLAAAVGLRDTRPVVPVEADLLDTLVTYVPVDDAPALVAALSGAGAGAIGDYEQCAWTVEGQGQFLPRPGADPTIGAVGRLTVVRETRIEMVLPRRLRASVVRALRAAHPYEEPAFTVVEAAPVAGRAGHGRIGELPEELLLRAFAGHVARVLPATAHGVRVSGDLDAPVRRVAVSGGSGDAFLADVRAAGADVYVCADLRHHPVSELREETGGGRPYLVDVAHFASEWPWLPRAAATLEADVAAAGAVLATRVSTVVTDPWTARLDAAGHPAAAPPSPGGNP
jgi:dinuclear metal center YbgI/SA1388 family protein